VYFGTFNEFTGRATPAELVDIDKVILAAALLAGPRRARGERNR
jgi:hypothetical protein